MTVVTIEKRAPNPKTIKYPETRRERARANKMCIVSKMLYINVFLSNEQEERSYQPRFSFNCQPSRLHHVYSYICFQHVPTPSDNGGTCPKNDSWPLYSAKGGKRSVTSNPVKMELKDDVDDDDDDDVSMI
jgi:hypothetical protein